MRLMQLQPEGHHSKNIKSKAVRTCLRPFSDAPDDAIARFVRSTEYGSSSRRTRMSPDGWRALRRLALEGDTTLNALAIEAFNDLLRKYGKKASVENPLVDGAGFSLRGLLIDLA